MVMSTPGQPPADVLRPLLDRIHGGVGITRVRAIQFDGRHERVDGVVVPLAIRQPECEKAAFAAAALNVADWTTLVPTSPLAGDSPNLFAVESPRRFTHVRLTIHPDGGVARLRVHGEVVPDPDLQQQPVERFRRDPPWVVLVRHRRGVPRERDTACVRSG